MAEETLRRRGGTSDGQYVYGRTNEFDEQLVAQGLPPYTEIVRKGKSWRVMTSTAFAPVAALPTTTAHFELYNPGNNDESIIVQDLYAFQVLSTAATQTYSIWAQVTATKAAPTAAALTIASNSGKDPVTGATGSFVVPAVGTTVVATGWRPFGSVQAWGTAAATPGNAWSVPVDGTLICPPGHSVCIAIVGSIATASSFHCGLSFLFETIDVQD